MENQIIKTSPIQEILPVGDDPNGVSDLLSQFSDLIREIVNFGTHILKWDVTEVAGGDEKLPALMMFRHILEMIDSVSVLVKGSSIEACKPILRSVLESYFQLEYVLEKDTERRALSFLV